MSSKEELDNSIVDAIDTYKKAKREELVRAVEDASDAYYAADDARDDAKIAYGIATNALAVYDKENT